MYILHIIEYYLGRSMLLQVVFCWWNAISRLSLAEWIEVVILSHETCDGPASGKSANGSFDFPWVQTFPTSHVFSFNNQVLTL